MNESELVRSESRYERKQQLTYLQVGKKKQEWKQAVLHAPSDKDQQ